ncbi:MAG: aspartate kinase [Gammaproteobacteria bacterium]|nr:aspartate kinase [Gammaproteobacteria bacterium]MBT5406107.1 aspartate kinase [Gammaproteobacteria bacterium]MBT5644254.1 aspartate kinase [Gammaproteobacteria bacterium]MBT5863005.1 aspartate kinase [Gammaproteobacteria bacterium]MBT6733780.1 aspartate kinase [Gammaproteobacteria bacterium]|tara:strand:- start:299 stop:1522 length:1224 start_codon:yes stop_codon:yes gene_type:complete
MTIIVKKFGGSSVSSIQKLKNIAKTIVLEKNSKNNILIVLSAMGNTTDELVAMSVKASKSPNPRDYDMLLSTGEQVSVSLLSMILNDLGVEAISLTGWQAGIQTDSANTSARILDINTKRIKSEFSKSRVVVVAGFQGLDSQYNISTLGRGGSDTTAVALAAALKANECQIYTDVDGVYTTDPRVCSKARKLDVLTYEEMLEMSGLGSKVLQLRSVEFASKYNVPVRVLHAHRNGSGTLIKKEEKKMEGALISGIAFTKDEAEVMIKGVKDQPGVAAKILGPIGEANIEIDMIVQNVGSNGLADFTFTVSRNTLKKALQVIDKNKKTMMYDSVSSKSNIVKVSIVGVGMRSHAGIASKMFKCLAKNKVNIRMISTSEIKISVVIDQKNLELAVKALHNEFKLEKIKK